MSKYFRSVASYLCGGMVVLGLVGFFQDRFGSLDAYVAHLREPGVWLQIPVWFWVVQIVAFAVGQIAIQVTE